MIKLRVDCDADVDRATFVDTVLPDGEHVIDDRQNRITGEALCVERVQLPGILAILRGKWRGPLAFMWATAQEHIQRDECCAECEHSDRTVEAWHNLAILAADATPGTTDDTFNRYKVDAVINALAEYIPR